MEVSDLESTWLTHNRYFQQTQSTNPFQEVSSVDVKLISCCILETENHGAFLLKQFLLKILFKVYYIQHLIRFVWCWQSEAFLHMRSLPVQDTEDEDILQYVQTLGGTSFELLQDEDMKKHLVLSMRETARVL